MDEIKRKQRLNLFFDNQYMGIIGIIVTMIALQYILIPLDKFYPYALIAFVINIPRLFVVWEYKKKHLPYLEWVYSLLVLANSLFSSYILYEFFPQDTSKFILATLFITGQTAGSLSSLGTSLLSFSFFNIPMISTWAYLIAQRKADLSEISIFMGFYLIVLLFSSFKQMKVVNQRFALEKQLESQFSFTFLQDILKGLSHELNNHLMTIEVQKEILKLMDDKNSKLNAVVHIDASLEKIKKLMALVVKNPKEVDFLEEVSLGSLVHNFSKSFELKSDLHINCELEDSKVKVNQVVLKQVFHHLLANADEAGANSVKITMTKEREYVFVRFWDDADKIKPEHVSKLMVPFYTTKSVNKHKGNGLTLCKQYLNRMNGDIYLDGDYKTFIIKLPLIV